MLSTMTGVATEDITQKELTWSQFIVLTPNKEVHLMLKLEH